MSQRKLFACPWEQSGAMPMPVPTLNNIFKLGSEIVSHSYDDVIASAPLHVYRGIYRLGLSGTREGSVSSQVIIESSIKPGAVVSTRLELEDGVMGRPLIGYDGITANSYFGDKFSRDENFVGIGATAYREGYGLITFAREDGSLKIVNDLDPKDIAGFIGTCLGVIRYKNKQ